jgi:hypothetical protein
LLEHEKNVRLILNALREAGLYCAVKKSSIFNHKVDFLGHRISECRIEVDTKKVEHIINWPVPKNSTEICTFLGLVCYVTDFLPLLADHTIILLPLTHKSANSDFPPWTSLHQSAFKAIKSLVLSCDCLTTIDHDNISDNKIFVTCNASDRRMGAVLSYRLTWESARPIDYDSMSLKAAQLNYPVHEKELFVIIRALQKWRSDLLGTPILIYTDHRTLENFDQQKDLSCQQARWQEFLAQYDYKIICIPGEPNIVADALSWLPDSVDNLAIVTIAVALSIQTDPTLLENIKSGYDKDPFCLKINKADKSIEGIEWKHGLLYIRNCLVIPRVGTLQEDLFHLAHDSLGHFGFEKSYASLQNSYYWPNMQSNLQGTKGIP